MIERLIERVERLPMGARRGLMVLLPVLLLAVVAAAFAFAPTVGTVPRHRSASTSATLLPPASTGTISTSTQAATRAPSSAAATRGARGSRPLQALNGGEAPRSGERPPSPRAPVGRMLAVARQFSDAYMPYQIGRLPGWVRETIERTCTPAFARYLLAQPPRLTAQLAADPKAIETYRVAGVFPIRLGSVRVNYAAEQDSADTGAFVLTLTARGGGWLVSGLEA